MKRICELCNGMARMHCESDQASLCWDCDAKVHSANFLVARHSRNLLCRVCQSLTPWSASGAKLAPTVSVCEQCVGGRIFDETDEEDEVEEEEDEEVEEEMENQVVPWSPPPPPPPAESSSSSEEAVSGSEVVVSRKRCRHENACSDHYSDDDQDCSSSHVNIRTPPSYLPAEVASMTDTLSRRKPTPELKIPRANPGQVGASELGSLESLRRLHKGDRGSDVEMP